MTKNNQKDKFDNLTKHYQKQDWIDKPNIFASEILEYIPRKGLMLCLGDGQGQDSRFFAKKGYEVTATDLSEIALDINRKKSLAEGISNITIQKVDLLKPLPYKENTFDIVYSHLSLHYFDAETTTKILKEVHRVLRNDGFVCIFTNSINDPEFTTGKVIESEFLEIEGVQKRFFSVGSMEKFTSEFTKVLSDDKGETYKDAAKGIHNLIRYIGKK